MSMRFQILVFWAVVGNWVASAQEVEPFIPRMGGFVVDERFIFGRSGEENKFWTVQEAVRVAKASRHKRPVILVQPGRYHLTEMLDLGGDKDVIIAATGNAAETEIVGLFNGPLVKLDGKSVLQGLTLTHATGYSGPAVSVPSSADGAWIADCVISENHAPAHQRSCGIEFLKDGHAILKHTSVVANSGPAAISLAEGSKLELRSSLLANPEAKKEIAVAKGAKLIEASSLVAASGKPIPVRPDGRLRAGAPVDGADPAHRSEKDLDGERRPRTKPDIGADEFKDADRDGMPDAWEDDHFNKLTDTPGYDVDEDGLSNLEEFNAGTHPIRRDTDGDGVSDGDELKRKSDPLVANIDAKGAPGHSLFWIEAEGGILDSMVDRIAEFDASGDYAIRASSKPPPGIGDRVPVTGVCEYAFDMPKAKAGKYHFWIRLRRDNGRTPQIIRAQLHTGAWISHTLSPVRGEKAFEQEWEWQEVSLGKGKGPVAIGSGVNALRLVLDSQLSVDRLLLASAGKAPFVPEREGIYNRDKDADGLPDTWEMEHFSGTRSVLPGDDRDRDGLTNLQEFKSGTDPSKDDTDEDGLSDRIEVETVNLDPLASEQVLYYNFDPRGVPNGLPVRVLDRKESFPQFHGQLHNAKDLPSRLPFSSQPTSQKVPIVREATGMAAGFRNKDCLWVIQGEKGGPGIIGLGTDGSMKGALLVKGAKNVSWGGIASRRDGEQSFLYFADTGDTLGKRNLDPADGHPYTIYRIEEPDLTEIEPSKKWIDLKDVGLRSVPITFAKADGKKGSPPPPDSVGDDGREHRDCETLVVDPQSGDLYLISKVGFAGDPDKKVPANYKPQVFLITAKQFEAYEGGQPPVIAKYLGQIEGIETVDFPAEFWGKWYDTRAFVKKSIRPTGIVAGDVSPDGQEILIKTYDKVYQRVRAEGESFADCLLGKYELTYGYPGMGTAPKQEPRGESLSFSADGNTFYTYSRRGLPGMLWSFGRDDTSVEINYQSRGHIASFYGHGGWIDIQPGKDVETGKVSELDRFRAGSFTISTWCMPFPSEEGTPRWHSIFTTSDEIGGALVHEGLFFHEEKPGAGSFVYRRWSADGKIATEVRSAVKPCGFWYHIAVSFDKTANRFRLFLNSSKSPNCCAGAGSHEVAETVLKADSAAGKLNFDRASSKWRLGFLEGAPADGNSYHLLGAVDDLRIYRAALPAAAISEIACNESDDKADPDRNGIPEHMEEKILGKPGKKK